MRPTSHSAMSIPAETPWLVTRFPSTTYRASRTTVMSPRACRASSKPWCVATRRPRAGPASCSSSAPVHTLVVQVTVADVLAIQSMTAAFDTSRLVPMPPGTSSTSSGTWSSKVLSGRTRMPLLQRTGPGRSAISTARSPWSRAMAEAVNTSQGPAKSSSSAPSKISSPYVVMKAP
jgi:hypothetical protein